MKFIHCNHLPFAKWEDKQIQEANPEKDNNQVIYLRGKSIALISLLFKALCGRNLFSHYNVLEVYSKLKLINFETHLKYQLWPKKKVYFYHYRLGFVIVWFIMFSILMYKLQITFSISNIFNILTELST